MRKTISAFALLLALVCSARAGEIQNGVASPDPSTDTTQEQPTGGEVQNDSDDDITQVVLDVISVLPSLL
jgi:hypothetical protein